MSFFKNKPYRNKKYLKYVSSLWCAGCGADSETNVAHHLIGVGQGKMGGKASDKDVMPLCYTCHADIHLFTEDKEIQFRWIAETLAQAKKDKFKFK